MNNFLDLNRDFNQYFSVAIEDVEINSNTKQIVFTFYPKADKFEHYHIELSNEISEKLYDLLGRFLEK